MLHSIRSVALLMLVAGICLGVFAGTLVGSKHEQVSGKLDPMLEGRVQAYCDYYDLDEAATGAVRRELQRYRRLHYKKLQAVRRDHQDEFRALVKDAEKHIHAILVEAGALPTDPEDQQEPSKD